MEASPIPLYWLLLPLLSLDSFTVSVALASHDGRRRIFWLLVLAEASAPLLGFLIGGLTGRLVPPRLFGAIAAVLLLLLSVMLLREAGEDADEAEELLERTPLLAAVAVGADEFGFGLTLPYLHAYALLPAALIALQAPIAVGLGFSLGDRARRVLWLRWVPPIGVLVLGVLEALAAFGFGIPAL